MGQVSAGILLIGDELLAGETADANLKFIAEQLNIKGIQIKEARVLPDESEVIISTISQFCRLFDYVFTTGGIGPTHDDITSSCVADAFGVGLELRDEAKKALVDYAKRKGNTLKEEALKMALIPAGATLILNPRGGAPAYYLQNVFVLPGVPSILQSMFPFIQTKLNTGSLIYKRMIAIPLPESYIATSLTTIQSHYPQMKIGSYPNPGFTKIIVRGHSEQEVISVKNLIKTEVLSNYPQTKITEESLD